MWVWFCYFFPRSSLGLGGLKTVSRLVPWRHDFEDTLCWNGYPKLKPLWLVITFSPHAIVCTSLTLGLTTVRSMTSQSSVSLTTCTEDYILHTARNRNSKNKRKRVMGRCWTMSVSGVRVWCWWHLCCSTFPLLFSKHWLLDPIAYLIFHRHLQTGLLYQVIAFFTYNIFAQICSKCTVYRPADFQVFLPRHLLPTASNSDEKLYSLSSLLVYGSAVLFGEYTHI